MTAWSDGFNAKRDGVGYLRNPEPIGMLSWYMWLSGWHESAFELWAEGNGLNTSFDYHVTVGSGVYFQSLAAAIAYAEGIQLTGTECQVINSHGQILS